MGYRGSKSPSLSNKRLPLAGVKEQRVDGSWFLNINKNLRCTLMGFERNYQTKISSKQFVIQNKNFCSNSQCKNLPAEGKVTSRVATVSALKGWTDANLIKLNPWFVTGFTDAEGWSLRALREGLYIYKNKNYKTGWSRSARSD
jgi:hypothetical protein